MKPITLKVSQEEAQMIVNALAELPIKIAGNVFANVRSQATEQLQPPQIVPDNNGEVEKALATNRLKKKKAAAKAVDRI